MIHVGEGYLFQEVLLRCRSATNPLNLRTTPPCARLRARGGRVSVSLDRLFIHLSGRRLRFPTVSCDRPNHNEASARKCCEAGKLGEKQVAEEHSPSESDVLDGSQPGRFCACEDRKST